MNFTSVFISNGIGITLSAVTIASSWKRRRFGLLDDKLFASLTILIACLCALEATKFYLDGADFTGARVLLYFFNSMLFLLNDITLTIWLMFEYHKIHGSLKGVRHMLTFALIPVVTVFVLLIVNLFYPVIFNLNSDNVYERGSLIFITFALTYIYFIFSVGMLYVNHRKMKSYLFLPILSFVFFPTVGSLIQFAFYGVSLSWVCASIALVVVYINIQNNASSIDSLTRLYSRMHLDGFLQRECSHRSKNEKALVGTMIDIDEFKKINDTFGHLVGDDALRNISNIIYSVAGNEGFAARYAGDEFVLLIRTDRACVMDEIIERIYSEVARFNKTNSTPYKLSFSHGTVIFNPVTDTVDGFIKKMDEAMYKDKRRKKNVQWQ